MPDVIYAIGDIHGEADRLARLHGYIYERHAFEHGDAPLTLVHLGDYVDRGPDSYKVIEYLATLKTPPNAKVINLKGNHEEMMLDAIVHNRHSEMWLSNGGDKAMESYSAAGYQQVPQAHIDWLEALPSLYRDEAARLIFVHAGIDVRIWPEVRDEVHLWSRSPRFFKTDCWDNPALDGWRIVHGHTPTDDFYPEVAGDPPRRINLDTGACFGGRLTAAKFAPGKEVSFLYS